MTKDERIKAEKDQLSRIFQNIPESKKKLTETLVQNAAYMAVTLSDLQAVVNDQGAVITSTNGNGFDVTQEHPANKAYVQMVAKYTTIINQLIALLPDTKEDIKSKAGESLAAFVAAGKPKYELG